MSYTNIIISEYFITILLNALNCSCPGPFHISITNCLSLSILYQKKGIIVANKSDLSDLYPNKIVSEEEGKQLANSYGFKFTLTSAKCNAIDFRKFVNEIIAEKLNEKNRINKKELEDFKKEIENERKKELENRKKEIENERKKELENRRKKEIENERKKELETKRKKELENLENKKKRKMKGNI